MVFSLKHLFASIMTFVEFKSRWSFVVCAEFVISVIFAVDAFEITTLRTIFTNTMLCALENPNLVLNKVRYKQECLLLCQGDSRCANVNWKAQSTCEMYFYYAGVFGDVEDCVYFGQGEKFNFHEDRSITTSKFKTGYPLKHGHIHRQVYVYVKYISINVDLSKWLFYYFTCYARDRSREMFPLILSDTSLGKISLCSFHEF